MVHSSRYKIIYPNNKTHSCNTTGTNVCGIHSSPVTNILVFFLKLPLYYHQKKKSRDSNRHQLPNVYFPIDRATCIFMLTSFFQCNFKNRSLLVCFYWSQNRLIILSAEFFLDFQLVFGLFSIEPLSWFHFIIAHTVHWFSIGRFAILYCFIPLWNNPCLKLGGKSFDFIILLISKITHLFLLHHKIY